MDRPSASRTLDRVQEYGKEALALGMLFLEFKDAIREGDGTRVLRCWNYFLSSGHTNYCLEAFNLLVQYYYTLSPRLAEQMLWGCFVNSEGKIAHNISCDLHMEHLNRDIKGAINHLSANKSPKAILRAGKALHELTKILHHFDRLNGTVLSDNHTRRSHLDLLTVIIQLSENNIFRNYHWVLQPKNSRNLLDGFCGGSGSHYHYLYM